MPTGSIDDINDPNNNGSIGDEESIPDIISNFASAYMAYPTKNVDIIVPNSAYKVMTP